MDFNNSLSDHGDRISYGIGIMSEGCWIDNDWDLLVGRFMKPMDHLGLIITLSNICLETKCLSLRHYLR